MQSLTPNRKTQIKTAVPAVAVNPMKKVIHESQRYHLIKPFRFDSSEMKLRSPHVNVSCSGVEVETKHSPISRLEDDEGTQTTLYPSYDNRAMTFALVWLYTSRCCGTLNVKNSFHRELARLDSPHT